MEFRPSLFHNDLDQAQLNLNCLLIENQIETEKGYLYGTPFFSYLLQV